MDRFEDDGIAIHEARRRAFHHIARAEPDRCVIVDAAQGEDDVFSSVCAAVKDRLEQSLHQHRLS